jgi:hypothetical protein
LKPKLKENTDDVFNFQLDNAMLKSQLLIVLIAAQNHSVCEFPTPAAFLDFLVRRWPSEPPAVSTTPHMLFEADLSSATSENRPISQQRC